MSSEPLAAQCRHPFIQHPDGEIQGISYLYFTGIYGRHRKLHESPGEPIWSSLVTRRVEVEPRAIGLREMPRRMNNQTIVISKVSPHFFSFLLSFVGSNPVSTTSNPSSRLCSQLHAECGLGMLLDNGSLSVLLGFQLVWDARLLHLRPQASSTYHHILPLLYLFHQDYHRHHRLQHMGVNLGLVLTKPSVVSSP